MSDLKERLPAIAAEVTRLAGRDDWILSATGIRFTTDHQDQEKDALIVDLQQKVTNLQQQVADLQKQLALQDQGLQKGGGGTSADDAQLQEAVQRSLQDMAGVKRGIEGGDEDSVFSKDRVAEAGSGERKKGDSQSSFIYFPLSLF